MDELPIEPTQSTTAELHAILPDLLPSIVHSIDRGSTFKAFRATCRVFKELADKFHPDADIKFANTHKILLKKFNMVPTDRDALILILSHPEEYHRINSFPKLKPHQFKYALKRVRYIDFDALVAVVAPLAKGFSAQFFKLIKNPDDAPWNSNRIKMALLKYTSSTLEAAAFLLHISDNPTQFTIDPPSKLYNTMLKMPELWITSHSKIPSLDVIQDYPKYSWNYDSLSLNPNITKKFYFDHLNESWSYWQLLGNLALDFEFARSLGPDDRLYKPLFCRIDVSWEYLTCHLMELTRSKVLICARPHCATDEDQWLKIIDTLLLICHEICYSSDYQAPSWKNFDPNVHDFKSVTYSNKRRTMWIKFA